MAEAEVLILGRTRAGRMICVGGLRTDNWTTLRLRRNRQPPYWPPPNCPFMIGEVYNIRYMPGLDEGNPHHRENVFVLYFQKISQLDNARIREILTANRLVIACDRPVNAFRYTGNRQPFRLSSLGGYYLPQPSLACLENSIAFWSCPDRLEFCEGRYVNRNAGYNIKYVGCAPPAPALEPGVIIRLSTSTVWEEKESAFLQLSGWF